MKRMMCLLALSMLASSAGECADGDRFFARALAGYSIPSLPGLSEELSVQGREDLGGGYTVAVSLGRSILQRRWTVSAGISISFYEKIYYENDYKADGFDGSPSHYLYSLLVTRSLLPDADRFRPSIGVGAGYGRTDLIRGGGRLESFEGALFAQCEYVIRGNIGLLFEACYRAGFTDDEFDKPFLDNLPGDAILDSGGDPLDDRFSSVEIGLGIIVWLNPPSGY